MGKEREESIVDKRWRLNSWSLVRSHFSQFVKLLLGLIRQLLAHFRGHPRSAWMVTICTLSLHGTTGHTFPVVFSLKRALLSLPSSHSASSKDVFGGAHAKWSQGHGGASGFAGNSHSQTSQSLWTGTGHWYGLSAMLSGRSSHTICSQMPGFAQSYLFLFFFFFFKFPSLPIFTNTKQENLDRIRSHWSDWVLSELSVRRPAHWRMVLGFIRKKKWQLPCTHVSFLLVPGQTCFERLKEVRGPIPSLMRSSSGRPLKLNKGGTLVFTRVTITCHYFELPGADFSTRPKTAAKKGVHLVQLNHCW